MAIPEHKLASWSGQGAQKASENTYASIKHAFDIHDWPDHMGVPKVYLQGSYPNFTNIRGDSDVDIVVESADVFNHNVPNDQRSQYGLPAKPTGAYGWPAFKAQVLKALQDYYGNNVATQGKKCIKIAGDGNRLNADVVPCLRYRQYYTNGNHAKGITFWTRDGIQVVNFPKLHLSNGSDKNKACVNCYKPNIRVFKNARNEAGNDFPSYFLECLLHNVPSDRFSNSFSDSFVGVIEYLNEVGTTGSMADWYCQNGQQKMFGNKSYQVDISEAHQLVNDLIDLWNNWA